MISKGNPELGLKLYLVASLAADKMFSVEKDSAQQDCYRQIVSELLTQAYCLHDDEINDGKAQQRCIVNMVGTLLNCQSLAAKDFETFITKTAQYGAKLTKKQDQCEMVALCSHLFYSVGKEVSESVCCR
jgi:vacuolar protein sorting-associated protein 35